MPKRIRTFIGIEVVSAVRQQLVELQDRLRAVSGEVKWVEPENLHLTLKFLGDVDEQDLYAVCKTADEAVSGQEPFEMTVAGVGAFPNAGRPRTIWAGVTQGSREAIAMQANLERLFAKQGYPREDRRYTPHLTLGRSRHGRPNPDLAGLIQQLADWQAGPTSVSEILVMASQLTPNGPIYSIMGRGRLRAAT
jgi:2'-5' RNA ligase